MYNEKNECSVITLEREIHVFGISHKRSGIGMFQLWDHMDAIQTAAKNLLEPVTAYGLWIDPRPDEDYLVGVGVASPGGCSGDFSTYTIPAGRYIEITFNAENTDRLLGEKLGGKYKEAGQWADEQGLQINWDVTVEAYPAGLFEMEHPEMRYLCHIKD